MRTILFYSTQVSQMTTSAAAKATFSPPATIQRSPWHSPVPYLFGGLAAMLGLIAFALLILACSYWRFSGRQVNDEENGGDQDGKGDASSNPKAAGVFEEKFCVIMAGNINPTFLATMVSSKASSFNDHEKSGDNKIEKEEKLNPKDQTILENEGIESHVISNEQSH